MSERLAMRPVADVILAPPCAWHEVRPLTCAWAIPSRPAVQRQRVALTGWPVIAAGSGLCTAMGWHGTRQTNPPATRTRSAPSDRRAVGAPDHPAVPGLPGRTGEGIGMTTSMSIVTHGGGDRSARGRTRRSA